MSDKKDSPPKKLTVKLPLKSLAQRRAQTTADTATTAPGTSTGTTSSTQPLDPYRQTSTSSKRKRGSSSEESSTSSSSQESLESSLSAPIADVVSGAESSSSEPQRTFRYRQVKKISDKFPDFIPKDAPARQQDLEVLARKGFNFQFTNIKQLGTGKFGTIYECTFNKTLEDGREINKVLAYKRVAINEPETRMEESVEYVEKQILNEMRICKLIMHNPHKNVTKHELVWRITATELSYRNPIIHLIFMEKCDGSLFDFVVQNFGYSTAPNNYKGPTEFVNKIWMYHVCQGLEFLHNADKTEKGTTSWLAIIHHDLKHENILYQTRGDQVKFLIADFGLSEVKINFPGRNRNQQNVWSSSHWGSERFMSPEALQLKEQLKGKKAQTIFQYEARKNDVYALAVMLSDCLVGFTDKASVGGKSKLANVWLDHLEDGEKDEYKAAFPAVSDECLDLLFRMADRDTDDRPFVADILEDRWLDEERLKKSSFVDWTGAESGHQRKRRKHRTSKFEYN